MKGYLYGFGSVLMASIAQLLLKWGMVRIPEIERPDIYFSLFIDHFNASIAIILGLLAYMISMLSWFFTLRYLPLHKAYPLVSISYALVYLSAVFLPCFNEKATMMKTLGVGFILLGLWITASPGRHKKINHGVFH